ncbi:MAG: SurA N-terminal domain-containing protein [Candidatus Thiodiazotropha taylori]|nr:SurA N-terminal domain-containing protein [Candidatus Thiodiazotropha taylori]
MLQEIRDKAQGWIAWAIVILISIPFALWGIQSYLGIGSEPLAASVNGVEITERSLESQFQRFRQQLRDQLGSAYRPELFDDVRMRKEVLNRMVNDEVLQQASHEMGLRAGNSMIQAAILSMSIFHKDGRFDQETYERSLQLQGLSPAGFEERVRRALVAEQLTQAVESATFITSREVSESDRLQKQTREITYFTIPAADYIVDNSVTDSEVASFYESNESAFISPEKIKLEYILLDAAAIGETVDVDDELLRGFYDDNQDLYGLPEQRQASHILIQVTADADQAAVDEAKQKIEDLAEQVRAGESFAELAKQHSQDPGSAASGGDLGMFGKGIMDPAFENAVFSLEEGAVSDPVRSNFGFHLIKLTGIKAGSVKPFDEAKSEVEKGYRLAEGEKRYFEMAEELANLSYDDPTSLESSASALGLTVEESEWMTRDQQAGPLAKPKVLGAAFSDDVLKERNNSELIELDSTSSVVVRVLDHQEASVEPLDDVRSRIVELLTKQKAEEQAGAEAAKRVAEISTSNPLMQVAGTYPVTGPITVTRNSRELPPALSSELFRTAKPQAGEITPGSVKLAQGDFAVFALSQVTEGESVSDESKGQQVENMRRLYGRSYYDRVLEDLESRADVQILLKQDSE